MSSKLNLKLSKVIFLFFCLLVVSACGGGGGGSSSDVNENTRSQLPENQSPVANAGTDITVSENQNIILSGSGFDPEGDALLFRWVQIAGTPVILINDQTQNVSFLAPQVENDITLEFNFVLTDSYDNSSSDNIVITVVNDELPIANAGDDIVTNEQSLVVLDARNSIDEGGQIINYTWTQLSDVKINFDDANSVRPSFTAPVTSEVIQLNFLLTVTDNSGNTATDDVSVMVNPLPAGDIPLDGSRFLTFLNQSSPLFQESQASADAYYAAIDPRSEKLTLDAWRTINGFDAGTDARAVYRNAADLGFGRVMSFRSNSDGTAAAYVENYATLDEAVTAVETGERTGLLATVAMDYSPHPDDLNGDKYTKFYIFNGNDERVTNIDLDGRGEKFQPGLCNVCHGGRPKQLVNGIYPDNGDTGAQFLPWDLDTYEFSTKPLFTREAQEEEFKKLNQAVLAIYPNSLTAKQGQWSGNPSRELIQGWYGDNGDVLPSPNFNGDFVPLGWRTPENGGPSDNPPDVETLYLKVVGPNCRACHIQRGNQFEINNQAELIDFTSYAKFIAYKEQIIDLVYDQGKMPDALVTFNNFWSEKDGVIAAEVLGVHLGINALERRPGRPIANAGVSRQAPLGNVQLSGVASAFAQTFQWSFTANGKPANSQATIVGATTENPSFFADMPGVYNIQLIVSDNVQQSEPAVVTVVALNGVEEKSFAQDIMPIMASTCISCHSEGLETSLEGIPIRFDQLATLYSNITAYINTENIFSSPILTKPSGFQHGAGELPREGFDLSNDAQADRDNYDVFVQWISEGMKNN